MGTQHAAGGLIITILAIGLVACAPEPAPHLGSTQRPSTLSSEDVAIEAAKATYRAYVDALNSDRETTTNKFEADRFLTGSALEAEHASRLQFERAGIRLDGDMRLNSLAPVRADASSVLGYVCLDVSQTRVLDETERDVTPLDRPSILGLEVTFLITGETALISESKAKDGVCS